MYNLSMPATYAHWAFGRDCIELMPIGLQKIVHEHRDIYNLGVHGPDILFYDLLHITITHYGSNMHNIPAREFFKKAKQIYKEHPECEDEILSYIFAFLTHFTLDSVAHSYVERKKEFSNISHNKIESQWERHLMILDGRTPNLVDRTESLKPNKKNTTVISYFFPFTQKEILRSCRAQNIVVGMLNSITIKNQTFYQKLLRKMKQYNYADLFIGFEEEEICADSNLRLDKLKQKALKLYPKLMLNLIQYLDDKEQLINYFDHNFSTWPNYQNIIVLPYEKELNYKL